MSMNKHGEGQRTLWVMVTVVAGRTFGQEIQKRFTSRH